VPFQLLAICLERLAVVLGSCSLSRKLPSSLLETLQILTFVAASFTATSKLQPKKAIWQGKLIQSDSLDENMTNSHFRMKGMIMG
jgi:hypothetical protein